MPVKQKSAPKPAAPRKKEPSIDLGQFKAEIEKRAKEIFLKRQKTKSPGDELSDWLAAEKEIKSKHLLP